MFEESLLNPPILFVRRAAGRPPHPSPSRPPSRPSSSPSRCSIPAGASPSTAPELELPNPTAPRPTQASPLKPRPHRSPSSKSSGPTAPATQQQLAARTNQTSHSIRMPIATEPPPPPTPASTWPRATAPTRWPHILAQPTSGSPSVIVAVATTPHIGPLKISTGVGVGLLLAPIQPIYPPIALARPRSKARSSSTPSSRKSGAIESATAEPAAPSCSSKQPLTPSA